MTKRPQGPVILFTGAGGRLGRLLRGAFAQASPPLPGRAIFAARGGGADLAFCAQGVPVTLPRCDMVVGLWGVTAGSPAELAQNADLAAATLAVARAAGAPRVLHLSSAAIYGPGEALTEGDRPNPAGAYGKAKLALEVHVARLAQSDAERHHCCARLANVVGADSLAPALRAPGPARLTRFADGRGPLRSYIGPCGFARVCLGLAALPPAALPACLNIAAPDPVGMEALLRAAGRSVEWVPPGTGDHQHVTLSTERLQGLLPGLALPKNPAELIEDWRASETAA